MSEQAADSKWRKEEISARFAASAAEYNRRAEVQQQVAERLIAALRPWTGTIPPGPILEVGCGTGFVTRGLYNLFPGRELEITDIAPEMVEYCRKRLGTDEKKKFYPLDAEELHTETPVYGLTVAGFVAQWFKDPALTLGRLLEATLPGGLMLASFPGSESFPEWKEACRELGIPFTGNTLPGTEEMVVKLSTGPVQVDYYEDTIRQQFKSALHFFRHLKQVGASVQQQGRHLSPREFRMLVRHWDEKAGGEVSVSYHVVFLAVKRDYVS